MTVINFCVREFGDLANIITIIPYYGTIMVKGLTTVAAKKRLKEHGPNELEQKEETTPLDVLMDQFKENVLIWILIVAAVASFAAGEMAEFYFVVTIIGIVAFMGFFQEWKAEEAMKELAKMATPSVKVYRDGEIADIPGKELVPGDLLKLEMGGKVPTDAKVIESNNLKVDESILTGESESVSKEKGDEIYSGTVISRGRCEAKVIGTGMKTKLGEIAGELQKESIETPLQRKSKDLAKKVGYLAIIASVMLFLIGIGVGVERTLIITVTIAVAVAVVPEALPLTMTLTLSLGMKSMAKNKAVVKKMLAVEGLGSTTVICTDKTGTLTKNEMTVKRIWAGGEEYEVQGSGYSMEGDILKDGKSADIDANCALDILVKGAALCSNASVNFKDDEVHGEPTEAALVTLVQKTKYDFKELRDKYTRSHEIQFNSDRKRMTTVHDSSDWEAPHAFMKGAPEVVLDRCTHVLENGEPISLNEDKKKNILKKNTDYARDALRVLAFAYSTNSSLSSQEDEVEKEMTFVGLTGIMDPPREEVPEAIRKCKDAGIRVKMVTGDNRDTAMAIAEMIGLTDNKRVVTGDEIDDMTEEELREIIKDVDIYARTHPGNKLQIVRALQSNGEIVAMTGDGVNDAPAVNHADIGIGMGIKGTDVTKEASDIILQDDNFSTIEKAIEEGRRIYDNIEKFVTFLLSRNFTEVILIASVLALFRDFALLPLLGMQILFLNMIGQVGPGLGLGVDPASDDLMKRPPRDPSSELLNRRNLFMISTMAVAMVCMASISYLYGLRNGSIELARTMTFTSISVMIMVNAYNFRSLDKSILRFNPLENKWIILSTLVTAPLVLLTLYLPVLRDMFGHVPLGTNGWLIAAGTGLATMFLLEVVKRVTGILKI